MPISVSVIIPTFNRAHMLTCAIESALRQTRSPDEIVIVDDCSTDNTQQLLESWKRGEPRIKVISHTVNQRPAGARNSGVLNASGDVVAFLDSDDTWRSGHLES